MRHLLLLFVLLWSCTSQSQQLNNEISKEGKKPYLLGKVDKNGFLSENYKDWFLKGFDSYQTKETITKELSKKLKDYDILVFMGTWCGDSRREIPHFYKILEQAQFPMKQLSVVAVSREPGMYKQSPNHEEAGLNIHRVPTFIFYKNGKEVNRIVEHPVVSLEEDIAAILTGNYTPNYHVVTEVHKVIEKSNFLDEVENQLPRLKKLSKSMFELNTYGRILASQKKIDKAIAVFTLNTKIHPDQPRTYMSLANTLGSNGYKNKAIKVLEEALKVHPDHKNLIQNLEIIKSN